MASLRWRLLAGTLAWVALTLAGTGWGLTALFRDHITQQWQAQLTMQLDELSGAIDWVDGQLEVGAMPEARFAQPLSGWYWQIDTRGASPAPGGRGAFALALGRNPGPARRSGPRRPPAAPERRPWPCPARAGAHA